MHCPLPRRPLAHLALAHLALAVVLVAAAGCAGSSRTEVVAARLSGRPQARSLTCESRAAADLLAFHGIRTSETEVFARIPRADNPDRGFVGDPDGPPGHLPPDGYGVHAEPVAAALRELGLDAVAGRDRTYDWLRGETAAGRPVLVWITASCDPSSRTAMVDAAGRPFTAVRGEHTVLVVGADGAGVTVVDPAGGYRRRFDREDFLTAWSLLDRMAVSARGVRPGAAASPR